MVETPTRSELMVWRDIWWRGICRIQLQIPFSNTGGDLGHSLWWTPQQGVSAWSEEILVERSL